MRDPIVGERFDPVVVEGHARSVADAASIVHPDTASGGGRPDILGVQPP